MSLRRHLLDLLSSTTIQTLEQGRKALLPLRSIPIDGFTLIQSRQLWYAWILYKFKNEQDVPETLWLAARKFILTSLKGEDINTDAKAYLDIFSEWKTSDMRSLVDDMAQYYFHTLELKSVIEETANEHSIDEWKASYTALLKHIQESAEKIGCWDALQRRIHELKEAQRSLVQQMMHKAFWDKIEEDIIQEDYMMVMCQLLELKQMLIEIIPSSFHSDLHEHLDIDFIKERISTQTFDTHFIVSLSEWIMESLKEWDSEHVSHLYDKEIESLHLAVQTLEQPKLLRTLLEICTVLALDLKTRKAVWRTLLQTTK
jgi:hypothetical protein